MLDKIVAFFKFRSDYDKLLRFRDGMEKIYEAKKCNMLVAHRNEHKERLKIYEIEINLLADILKKERVNAENVPDTCIAHPSRAK